MLARLAFAALAMVTIMSQPALAEDGAPRPAAERAAREAALAWDLYGVLRKREGNLFFSPHSISQALAMTYAGARGETAAEMARALHFDEGEGVHRASRELVRLLRSRAEGGGRGSDGKGFRLRVVNALWGQAGHAFEAPFLELLRGTYEAPLREVDYQADAEAARQEINAWVAEQTEEKIPELIPARMLDDTTRLVLTNAIYFNAAWDMPFEEDRTRPRAFARIDAAPVEVPFMHQTESFPYLRGEGFTAVSLPYEGRKLSMLLVVPDAGRFAEVEAGMDAERIEAIAGELMWERLALAVPRFEFRSQAKLKETLEALGMRKAFVFGQADFSGMTGDRELFVAEVVHEAYVKTNENGTEAAAATAVLALAGGVPQPPVPLVVDRPFLFVIRDASGAVLFVGRVSDPSAS